MDEMKGSLLSCKRTTVNSSKIPSTIEVSGSQETNGSRLYRRRVDKQLEKDFKNPRKRMHGDKSGTSANDQAYSSATESDIVSSLSEPSDSSPKVKVAAFNASITLVNDDSTEIEEASEETRMDRLKTLNEQLLTENEELRKLIEAIKTEQKQEEQPYSTRCTKEYRA